MGKFPWSRSTTRVKRRSCEERKHDIVEVAATDPPPSPPGTAPTETDVVSATARIESWVDSVNKRLRQNCHPPIPTLLPTAMRCRCLGAKRRPPPERPSAPVASPNRCTHLAILPQLRVSMATRFSIHPPLLVQPVSARDVLAILAPSLHFCLSRTWRTGTWTRRTTLTLLTGKSTRS